MTDARGHGLAFSLLTCLGILLALGSASPAHGQDTPQPSREEIWPFAAGRFSLGVQAGGGVTAAHSIREAKLFAVCPRASYVLAEQGVFLPGSVEVAIEPVYLYVWEGKKTSNLFGFTVDAKYNFRTGTRFIPSLEGGVGVSYATTRIPAGEGTNFNFIAQGGIGLQYVLTPKTTLDFRGIYHHRSNANTGRENPSLNSFILTLGASYHF